MLRDAPITAAKETDKLDQFDILVSGKSKGAFFWRYPGYSHSGLGITEYTEYQIAKEHILKTEHY